MPADLVSTPELLGPLNALANPHRLDLVQLLRDPGAHFPPQPAGPAEKVGVCVSDLQAKLRLSQSTTSQYLALLERAGLVVAQRIGQWTYWKLHQPRLRSWINRLETTLTHPSDDEPVPAGVPPLKLQDVLAARLRVEPYVRCTPLEAAPALAGLTGAEVRIKFEQLQHTGTSAPRAAVNWLRTAREAKAGPGIVLTGGSVREIALAYASHRLAVPVIAFVPPDADPPSVQQLVRYGAELRREANPRSAAEAAAAFAGKEGWMLAPAAAHPAALAGLGTIALELFEEFAGLEVAVLPANDPALFVALTHSLKSVDRGVKIVGARMEPAYPPGSQGAVPPLSGSSAGGADRLVTVSENELRSAATWILAEHRMALPPAELAAVAYVLSAPLELRDRRVAALIPGGCS